MDFRSRYTTNALIAADKTGVEDKKLVVSNDTYLSAEMILSLIEKIEQTRCSLMK